MAQAATINPSVQIRDNAKFGRLDAAQVGSIRQIENIVKQLDGEWSMMGGRAPFQEDFGAFRYQLAFAGYALALGHFHRLPNAPGVFKPIFERIIHKMMLPDVWSYWHDVSRGGAKGNDHLRGTLPEVWDPVKEDNIMFSAYLQVLSLMFNVLFDDDRFAQPGALKMGINPFHFGERMSFEYDQNTLNDLIYWQMVKNGYLGVACEPNCVFQVCNQIPIMGFRLHDILTGSSTAKDATQGYLKAWQEFGLLDAAGNYMVMVAADSRTPVPNANLMSWANSWMTAMMNTWNSDFVHRHYPDQVARFLVRGPDGTLAIRLWEPVDVRGEKLTLDSSDFGWAAAAASEMGDKATLEGLLAHADRYMNPVWRDGGLHYPRNDTRYDENGILRQVEPITGNALLPYARLNVPDGLRTFYNEPWDRTHFSEPLITDLSPNIDIIEAWFEADREILTFAFTPRADREGDAALTIANVFGRGRGHWILRRGDLAIASGDDESVLACDGIRALRYDHALELALDREGESAFELAWRAIA